MSHHIIRVGETKIKFKSQASRGIIKHAYRDGAETTGQLTADNIDTLLKKYIDNIPEANRPKFLHLENEKRRTGIGVEILITASPEIMKNMTPETQREYLMHGALFFADYKKRGYALLGYAVHFDEQTPHAHLFLVNTKTLNARTDFGSPELLATLQNDYFHHMQKFKSLDRYIAKQKRDKPIRHKTLKEFFKKVDHLDTLSLQDLVEMIEFFNNQKKPKDKEKNQQIVELIKFEIDERQKKPDITPKTSLDDRDF